MIKVAHIISGLDRGGAETVLFRFLRSQAADNGFKNFVISLRGRGFYAPLLEELGVEVYSLGLERIYDLPRASWRLLRLLQRLRPSLVHTWMYHADLLGGLIAKLAGVGNIVWGVHTVDLDAQTGLSTRIVRGLCALASWAIPSSIICVAEAARVSHIRHGYDAKKMIVIPNGFEVPILSDYCVAARRLRVLLGFDETKIVIGCVGRSHPDKGYDNFINAAHRLSESRPDVRFILIGRGLSADNSQLQYWIRERGLGSVFKCLGERDDIPACLLAMDIFCLPSRTEAFPLALGEAMAMARPCVTTNVGDAALLLGGAGVVVPAGDPVQLANGLTRVLTIPDEDRLHMGKAARARITDHFSLGRMVEQILDSYLLLNSTGSVGSSGRFPASLQD